MFLHNRVNRRELRQRLVEDAEPRTTLSFYRYFPVADPRAFRDARYAAWQAWRVYGRVYVAHEGINAQLSLPTALLDTFRADLYALPHLDGVRLNLAVDDNGKSFYQLKIKVRPKIVADGLDDATFDPARGGQHLDAAAFNRLTDDPHTLVVDMRNHYESEVGRFEHALCPDVDTFREALPVVEQLLAPHRDRPIVMYCTGGIRCEKASAWLRHRGFARVYQLDGGIIEYARQAQGQGLPNKFRGKNFVFDERLGERIGAEVISHCHQCGAPCDTHVNCRNQACNLLFIQCPTCAAAHEGCCSAPCQDMLHLPAEARAALRKPPRPASAPFRKARFGEPPTRPS